MDEPTIKTSKFWTFISKRMNAEAALADWRLMLSDGLDFAKLQRHYLTPTGTMANLITCPEQCNPSCGFRKVCEWEGKYEAVCRERRRKDYTIEKADALFFTVKSSGLLPEITKIFKIIPHIEEFGKEEDTWKLGVVPLSSGKSATVYLTLKIWNHEIMDLIFRLNCEEHKPYILLVTARKIIHGTSEKVLNEMGAAFVPLNEVLDFNAQTELELIRECNLAQLVALPTLKPEPEPENIFRKCGDAWEVRYQGDEKFILTNCNTGAAYLHFMLERPNTAIPILEIIRGYATETNCINVDFAEELFDSRSDGYMQSDLPISSSGEIADEEALRQYRQEVQLLLQEITIARERKDDIMVGQLQQDLEQITGAINEAVSPAGQKRKLSDPLKNITDAFRSAINFTIDKIATHNQELTSHLRDSIRYGQNPGYYSNHPIHWDL